MNITAAVLERAGKPLRAQELTLADPRPDEVLVRIVAAGICHTDLGVAAGATGTAVPIVLGHEGAGIVEAIGSEVERLAVGDHVVLSFSWCGKCANCRRNRMVHCESFMALNFGGTRLDGSSPLSRNGTVVHGHFFGQSSFASHAIATERNAVKVPREAPLELLAPLGCGIQTGAGTVLNALAPRAGSSIAVFAAGSVGLSAVMAAVVAGCDPIVAIDLHHQRLDLARELGATHVVDAADTDPVERVREITAGGADYSVEAIGLPGVVRQAVECLRETGVCATVGFQGLTNEIALDQTHLLFGRTLVGVIEGDSVPHEFIPRLIELYSEGKFPFDRLIERFPFEEINEAMAAAHDGRVLKPVLVGAR